MTIVEADLNDVEIELGDEQTQKLLDEDAVTEKSDQNK